MIDILTYILLILIVAGLFVLTILFKSNFLYVALIIFSLLGLVFSVFYPPVVVTGENTEKIYDNSTLIQEIKTPITEEVSLLKNGFIAFFLMSLFGAIVYWSYEEEEE